MCKVSAKLFMLIFIITLSVMTIFTVNAAEKCTECYVIDKGNFQYVAYGDIQENIIKRVDDRLQRNRQQLLEYFHIDEMSKVTVRIWNQNSAFLDEQKKRYGVTWPGATGYVAPGEIMLLSNPAIDQIAQHEFVHLLTMEVNPTFANNPRWLWEAIAIYKSEYAWKYAEKPYLISNRFDTLIAELNDGFNESDAIYEVGYTIGEYIEKTWGPDAIVTLIKNNGDVSKITGKPFDEIVLDWKAFVKDTYFW